MATTTSPKRSYEVSSLRRGLVILDCFVASPSHEYGVTEIARAVGIHRATAFRFLSTLESVGYIEAAGRPGSYRLGAKLHHLEQESPWPTVLHLTSVPILRELAMETGETADVGVLSGGEAMLVQVVEGSQSVRVLQNVGTTRPAHLTAIGKVLLASLSEADLEAWLAGRTLETRTPNSIGTSRRLRAELAEIRRTGYAVDEQEYELGLGCIAVPLRDLTGATIAAVAISAPYSRINYHRIPGLVAVVKRSADRLSAALGAPISRLQLSRWADGLPDRSPGAGAPNHAPGSG